MNAVGTALDDGESLATEVRYIDRVLKHTQRRTIIDWIVREAGLIAPSRNPFRTAEVDAENSAGRAISEDHVAVTKG